MVEVRKATIELFDRIYPLLSYFDIPEMDRDRWQDLLSTRWSKRHDYFGHVLIDSGRAVGFLGGFFHERIRDGRSFPFCNLFSWYVLEEFRQHSLLLLLPFLKEEALTVTSLTPSEKASVILRQFGFKVLDSSLVMMPVLFPCWKSRRFEIIDDPGEILKLVNSEDRQILSGHDSNWCQSMAIRSRNEEEGYCLVIFNKVRKKALNFTQVYYVSSLELFKKNLNLIQSHFFGLNRTLCTVVDRRLMGKSIPFPCFTYRLRYPRLYRSGSMPAEFIDNLYSELLFLKRI